MSEIDSSTPYGYCQCGCGQKAPLAPHTLKSKGWRKGEPLRFVHGHNSFKLRNLYIEEDRGYDTPCWIYQGYVRYDGYARIRRQGKNIYAHRFFYERENGPLSSDMHLDHLCRVRCCVRPSHLEPATTSVNTQRGDAAKLTRDQVQQIRALAETGELTRAQIGALFGIVGSHVTDIVHYKYWR